MNPKVMHVMRCDIQDDSKISKVIASSNKNVPSEKRIKPVMMDAVTIQALSTII